ncbi:MAG: glycine cleavage system aminomethyltransferase GcvT [Planctomycetaceae bacterium]|nr:glycine cleavage system aminomethyltransferase GcvT [Planctomycetaceae bacterium]
MLKTVWNDWHRAHGGRLVDFAGWDMPIQYSGIVDEHNAVRNRVGLFDIGHMGRLLVTGPSARAWVDRFVTCPVGQLRNGRIRYGLVCNADGGILDDVLVYGLDDNTVGLVVNASNREKIVAWLQRDPLPEGINFEDRTLSSAMLAVQGPASRELLEPIVGTTLADLKYYTSKFIDIDGAPCLVSRTGYTGEDGFEVILPLDKAGLWERLIEGGALPCGLGARDTLRLEAAMPLYGHELSEEIDPFQAGLESSVDLSKPDLIGRDGLLRAKADSSRPVRVGLQLVGKRIAREGATLLHDATVVGRVTSGTFSPTLQRAIAMGYIPRELAAIGTRLSAEIRGQLVEAEVVPLPFYKRGAMTAG